MRVIAKRTLREFWMRYPDAEAPLQAWHAEALKATWSNPQQVKEQFGTASVLKAGRLVFNIAGNKYRLIVAMDYKRQACFIKFIGTHRQYDTVDAESV